MFLGLRSFAGAPQRAGLLVLTLAAFAAGVSAGTLVAPIGAAPSIQASLPAETPRAAARAPVSGAHAAQVLRVLDGDTFEARVNIWPGVDVTTRVRLRRIDAPEMHARCDDERRGAMAAREALARILSEGGVGVTRVGQDKYGGRVDADVSTARTPDVAEALLARGLARRYDGGRRGSWCG
jgi:micrococcal nuclease